jgi:TolB-like protein
MADQSHIAFGPFELDCHRRSVTRDGAPIALGSRAFDVLAALVGAGGDLVTKDALLNQVWSRAVVDENNLQAQVSALRKALGDSAIVTVPSRGYRLAMPAQSASSPTDEADIAGKPAIAVLPFASIAGDAAQQYFADAMADEISTALARIPSIFVIVPDPSRDADGGTAGALRKASLLGVRYVVEGSVRGSAGRVRILVRLADAVTRLQLWAERFDGTIDDMFGLQDQVTGKVVAAVVPRLITAEIQRVQSIQPGKQRPYDLMLRGLSEYGTRTRGAMEEAIRLLRRAIALDPRYALAHAHLASILWLMVAYGWKTHDDPAVSDMLAIAQTALTVEGDDPEVLLHASTVLATQGGDLDGGIVAVEKSLNLSPNRAAAFRMLGVYQVFAGEPGAASASLAHADRLNPIDHGIAYNLAHVIGHFCAGDYEAVVESSAKLLLREASFTPALRWRAASLGLLGRVAEGRQVVQRILDLVPEFSVASTRRILELGMNNAIKTPGVSALFYRGLRLSGTPES